MSIKSAFWLRRGPFLAALIIIAAFAVLWPRDVKVLDPRLEVFGFHAFTNGNAEYYLGHKPERDLKMFIRRIGFHIPPPKGGSVTVRGNSASHGFALVFRWRDSNAPPKLELVDSAGVHYKSGFGTPVAASVRTSSWWRVPLGTAGPFRIHAPGLNMDVAEIRSFRWEDATLPLSSWERFLRKGRDQGW